MLTHKVIDQPKFSIIKSISILAFICLVAEMYFIGNKLGAWKLGETIGQCMVYSLLTVLIFPRRWLKTSSMVIVIPITLCYTIVCSYELYKFEALKHDSRQFISAAKTMINENVVLNNEQIERMNLGVFSVPAKVINETRAKTQDVF